MPIDVSVIIPTRNRVRLLAQTLRTVLDQQVDLEVIVVDEASTDATPAWLASLEDPRVSIIRHETPRGLPTARNVGLAAGSGRWVAFVDDDDLWLPTKLLDQLEAADRAGSSWVYGGALDITSEPRLLRITIPAAEQAARLPWANTVPGGGSNVIATRELLDLVGGFDITAPAAEDWDMWIRMWRHIRPAVVSEPVLAYRIHPGNMSRNVENMIVGMRQIEDRYWALRGGAGIDWEDAYRWIGAAALRSGDNAIARRVALAAVRSRHPGSWKRLARALVPVAPRTPEPRAGNGVRLRDRFRPAPVVAWPDGVDIWLREVLDVGTA
jgi:glycosyltransferase involved in cell wall biosynthesis